MTDLNGRGGDNAVPLMMALDHVEWDPRAAEDIAAEIRRRRPCWLRVANFFDRTLEVLRLLDRPQLVAWKLEFWGTDTPYDRVPASAGVDPAGYAKDLFALGHHIVPYAFSPWGRDRLLSLVPVLRGRLTALLPVAQKRPVPGEGRESLRRRLGVAPDIMLAGCGGLLHPAKGIEEIVGAFLHRFPDRDAHLLCGLVVEDPGDTEAVIRRRWRQRFGAAGMDRVHLRTGRYGDWAWMCAFYQAIDLMMVNSVSDSWGRMAAEPIGFGVPTLVRRADCGTNHIAPGLVLVDGFATMCPAEFTAAIRTARARAPELAVHVADRYGLPAVRRRWLEVLRGQTPPERRAEFDRSAADPVALAALDGLIVY